MTTTTEWRTEFNLLYNNILSNQAPGLNDYEISSVLTAAEEEVVITLYSGRRLSPFESTEELTQYLSKLVKQATLTQEADLSNMKICAKSHLYLLPDDLWFKTYEGVTVIDDSLACNGSNTRDLIVTPVTQDEFERTYNNPFKGQGKRRVLSLTPADGVVEIVTDYDIVKYVVRYMRRPKPIIISDLYDTGLSINGETDEQPCELHEALHRVILERAVQMARGIWENTVQSQSRQ